MTAQRCARVTLADLADYAAGDCADAEAAAIEEHTFSCPDCGERAAEYEALAAGVRGAMRAAQVGGLVTEAVLNRLAREGVRLRMYTLAPGDIVPCAVWDEDEVMVLRLRGDFSGVEAITVVQRAAGGQEISRASGVAVGQARDAVTFAIPASWVRTLPAGDIQFLLTDEGSEPRTLGAYTLRHDGSLARP